MISRQENSDGLSDERKDDIRAAELALKFVEHKWAVRGVPIQDDIRKALAAARADERRSLRGEIVEIIDNTPAGEFRRGMFAALGVIEIRSVPDAMRAATATDQVQPSTRQSPPAADRADAVDPPGQSR